MEGSTSLSGRLGSARQSLLQHPIVAGLVTALLSAVSVAGWNFLKSGAENIASPKQGPVTVTIVNQFAGSFPVGLPAGDPPTSDWALVDQPSVGPAGWARKYGGAEIFGIDRRLVLLGGQSPSVITNLRARILSRHEPLPTIVQTPPALARTDPVTIASIDLGASDPVAVRAGDPSDRLKGQPFFEAQTLSLAPGETQTVDLHMSNCDCSFELVFEVVTGGNSRSVTVRDVDGNPFRVASRAKDGTAWEVRTCGERGTGPPALVPATGSAGPLDSKPSRCLLLPT